MLILVKSVRDLRVSTKDCLSVQRHAYEFVCFEYFPSRGDRYVDHFLVLLQRVEAATHIAMEVIPRQQVLIDRVGIGIPLLLLLLMRRIVLLLLFLLLQVQLLLSGLMLGRLYVYLLGCGGWCGWRRQYNRW